MDSDHICHWVGMYNQETPIQVFYSNKTEGGAHSTLSTNRGRAGRIQNDLKRE